jgi:hypothetical protein
VLRLLGIAALAAALAGCGAGARRDSPRPAADARAGESHFGARGLLPDTLSGHLVQQMRDRVSRLAWPRTDFSRRLVPLDDFLPGGPPRDGIRPLDHPRAVSVSDGDRYLRPDEPVLALALGSSARAYPVRILLWHEIANDVLAGRPVAVTYCPLCNSGVAFDRRVDGHVLRLGTTGLLRRSDLVMWDRQTESWWQQLDGRALVGRLAGKRLRMLPLAMMSWADYKRRYPYAEVLAERTGYERPYGLTPYRRYDTGGRPFGFNGRLDRRLPAMERVLAVRVTGKTVAAPYAVLRARPVLDTRVGGTPVVIVYQRRVRSPLDARRISDSREVGTAVAYDRRLGGRTLSFTNRGGRIVDDQTGSEWDVTGLAVSGLLRGRSLRPLVQNSQFWFALAAIAPDARVVSVSHASRDEAQPQPRG